MESSILPLHRGQESTQAATFSSQSNGVEGILTLNFRESQLQLFFLDIKLVFKLLRWLPKFFSPLRTENPYGELFLSSRNVREIALHVCLGVWSGFMVIVSVPLFVVAPVSLFILYAVACNALMFLLCLPLNKGPRTLMSKVNLGDAEVRLEERWTFVNGVCAGQHWLQANIDMLSSIFRRPVMGIHNRSYGAVFDIIECIVQRCFSYATKDTRRTYEHLKAELINPNITKVVVIAHSQGGIILSAALDMLFADLPSEVFEKLEVYTFGCAANHFNNPLCRLPVQEGQNMRPTLRQIHHIEHYCNEYDFVARFGTLHFTRDKASNRFVGDLFVNQGQGGHLMNQHYLDVMFSKEDSPFLEQVILIDEDTTVEREKTEVAVVNTEVAGGLRTEASSACGVSTSAAGVDQVEKQVGKRVRDLSRLGRYRNGGSP